MVKRWQQSCMRVLLVTVLGAVLHGCARTGHYFAPKKVFLPDSNIVVPIHIEDGFSFVDVMVNNQGPYRFMLDTGAGLTVISEELAEEIRPRPIDDLGMYVAGLTGQVGVYDEFVEFDELRIGAASFRDVRAVVAEKGMGLGSVLSLNVFRDVLLTLDYPNRNGTIAWGELPEPDGAEILNLLDSRSKLAILGLRVQGAVQPTIVDSGSPFGLILQRASKEMLEFESGPIPGFRVFGIHGGERMWMGRLAGEVLVGKHVLERPTVRFTRSIPTLGYEVLQHFEVTFDMKRQRMRFRRESTEPVQFEAMEGYPVEFVRFAGERWTIADVVPRSIAFERGIREGHYVRAINDWVLPWGGEIRSPKEAHERMDAFLESLGKEKQTLRIEMGRRIVEVPWVVFVP